MRISYTQVSTYQRCPQQYKLQYVEPNSRPGGAGAAFGAALHETLNYMYTASGAPAPSLEDVVGASSRAGSEGEGGGGRSGAESCSSRAWTRSGGTMRARGVADGPAHGGDGVCRSASFRWATHR